MTYRMQTMKSQLFSLHRLLQVSASNWILLDFPAICCSRCLSRVFIRMTFFISIKQLHPTTYLALQLHCIAKIRLQLTLCNAEIKRPMRLFSPGGNSVNLIVIWLVPEAERKLPVVSTRRYRLLLSIPQKLTPKANNLHTDSWRCLP